MRTRHLGSAFLFLAAGAANDSGGGALDERNAMPAGFTDVDVGKNPFQRVGDFVTGQYVGKGTPLTIKGKQVNTFLVKQDNGDNTRILASAMIEAFFEERNVGDIVYIQYLGQEKGGQGNINKYRFAVKR